MRISDWSSDVCSSDLPADLRPDRRLRKDVPSDGVHRGHCIDRGDGLVADLRAGGGRAVRDRPGRGDGNPGDAQPQGAVRAFAAQGPGTAGGGGARKSGVTGKGVPVRVYLEGRGMRTKKQTTAQNGENKER